MLVFQKMIPPKLTNYKIVFLGSALVGLHNLRTSSPITYPQRIGVYLRTWRTMVDPACKFNEKGIREKNDGKEVPEEIKN